MNKYQKEKSREIRDIVNSDHLGKTTYKEAKRMWKKGYRALPGFLVIQKRAVEKGVTFSHTYLPKYDAHELCFTKKLPVGGEFEYYQCISADQLRLYRCPRMFLADHIMQELDMHMRDLGIISPTEAKYIENPISFTGMGKIDCESLYPKMVLHPIDSRSPEVVFGDIITKRAENLGGNA